MRASPTPGPRSGLALPVLLLAAVCCWSTVAATSGGDCAGYGHATKSFPQAYLECLQYLNLSRQSLDAFDEQANPPDSDANCLVRCVGLGTRWWDDQEGVSERALMRFFREPTTEQLEQARTCATATGPATDHCSAAYRAFRCYSEALGELVTHPRYLAPRRPELRSAVRDCAQVLQVPEESVASYVGQSFLLDERGSKLLHCVVVRLGLYSDTAGMLADRLALLPGTPSAALDTSEAKQCETRVRDFSTDPCLVAAHSAEQCYGREAFGELWPAMVEEYGVPMAPTVPKVPSDDAVELEVPAVPNQGVRSRLVYIRAHNDPTTGPTQDQELPAAARVPSSGRPFEMLIADKDYDEVAKLLEAESTPETSSVEPTGEELEPRQPQPEAQLGDSHVIRARSVMCPCYAPSLGPPYYPEFDPYPPHLGPPEAVHFWQPGPHYPGDYPTYGPPMFHPLVKRMAPYSDDVPVRPMQYPLYDDPFDVEGFRPELRFAREAFPTEVNHPYVATRDVPSATVAASKKDAVPEEDAVVEPLVAQPSRSKSKAKTSAVKPVAEKEQELPGKESPVLSDVAPEQDGNEELTPADREVEKEQELPSVGSPVLNDVAAEQDGNEELTPVEQEQDTPESRDGASEQDGGEELTPTQEELVKEEQGTPESRDGASEQEGGEELTPTQEEHGTPESRDGASEHDANEELTSADQEVEMLPGKGSPVLNDGGGNEELTAAEQLVEEKQDPETGTSEVNDGGAPEQDANEDLTAAEQVVQETETPKENGSKPEPSSAANPEVELTKSEPAAQPAVPLDTTPAEVPKAPEPTTPEPTTPEPTTPEPTAKKLDSVPRHPVAVGNAAAAPASAEPTASNVAPQPTAALLRTVVRPKRRGPMGVMEIIRTLARASLAA